MKPSIETLIRRPLPAKRYSGKDAIRELVATRADQENQLQVKGAEEEETGACEENYDLYFPRPDVY